MQAALLVALGAVLMLAFERALPARLPYRPLLAVLLVALLAFVVLGLAREQFADYLEILRDE